MNKDHILTPEEKLSKQQRLEENRRIRSTQIPNNDHHTKNEIIEKSPIQYTTVKPVDEKYL
jgi:hypothetical protein